MKAILELPEMPKSCERCCLSAFETYTDTGGEQYCVPASASGRADQETLYVGKYSNQRAPFCPLKPSALCSLPEKSPDGKCAGYQESGQDDDLCGPCESCKNCKDNQFWED